MTKDLTRSAARIYGALSALGQGSTDVLERLIPFFEPILRTHVGEQFNADTFAEEVRNKYNWNFNTDIVEVFVPRLVDAGWLAPDVPDSENSTHTINLSDQSKDSESEASAVESLRKIAKEFQEFSEALSPLTAIPRTVEEFEDILIEWLLYVEAFSEKNIDINISVRKDDTGTIRNIIEVPRTTSLRDEERFLCARFVESSIKNNPGTANELAKIASIGLLTEVIQDFVKPQGITDNSNLVVYLDAPVALELLGASGSAAQANTTPVIKELARIGARINIFEQSVDELKQSLSAVLKNPRPTGPTAQALARGEVLKEFISELAVRPEPVLERMGVTPVQRTIEQYPNEHPFFPKEYRDEIFNALKFQQNLPAREHDTDITTLVMRQRKGRTSRDIFNSNFLIVTRNGLFAQIVRKTCVELGIQPRDTVPAVVHRRVLAASMWLRTGLGADGLEIPKRMLLANCERVLAIRPGVVNAVKKFTDALGDEEKSRQLDLLIQQDRSAQMLMDKTLGASSSITEENFSQLFEEMLHPHLEEIREQSAAAIAAEKNQARVNMERAKKMIETEKEARNTDRRLAKEILAEDKTAIIALCEDVAEQLARRKNIHRTLALGLAITLAVAPFALNQVFLSVFSVISSILLTYLTISGSSLIGASTTEKRAFQKLQETAESRRLATKLRRFTLEWNGSEFTLRDSPAVPLTQTDSQPLKLF